MAISSTDHHSATRRRGDRLVGTSRAVQRALDQVAVAGRGHFPLFIHGEDGVDKELVARLTHSQSEWASNGFFSLDASIMPESLLARELIGCEAGAIPALPDAYEGAFARTRHGTVLIEHINGVIVRKMIIVFLIICISWYSTGTKSFAVDFLRVRSPT